MRRLDKAALRASKTRTSSLPAEVLGRRAPFFAALCALSRGRVALAVARRSFSRSCAGPMGCLSKLSSGEVEIVAKPSIGITRFSLRARGAPLSNSRFVLTNFLRNTSAAGVAFL